MAFPARYTVVLRFPDLSVSCQWLTTLAESRHRDCSAAVSVYLTKDGIVPIRVDGGVASARRVKNFHQRSSQFEQILKKNEQMFALLALTAGLCPAATRVLDESVLILLQDKCGSRE